MDVYTSSRGIAKNPQIRHLLKTNKVRLLSFLSLNVSKKLNPVLVGWGYKPNTVKARTLAKQYQLPYWALEDGFISWLNHPSKTRASQRLSYIVDKLGIYYDASKASGLDAIIDAQGGIDEVRLNRIREQLLKLKVSKYNQTRCDDFKWPSWLAEFKEQKTPFLLLVDQTFNDASIEYSGGSQESFSQMLEWTKSELKSDQDLHVVIKTHPDVLLGTKKGYLLDLVQALEIPSDLKERIHFLSEDVMPFDLIAMSSEVATVSSQMGFEALWQYKKVHCFAWPFYAGRGLTLDHCQKKLTYPRKPVSLNQLLSSALIEYPTYLHPDTQCECEIEGVLDYLQAHFNSRELYTSSINIPNISLWKRSFIPEFIASSSSNVSFSKNKKCNTRLLWGMKSFENKQIEKERLSSFDVKESNIWRIEDGFVRSVGLGADLRRPSSLVLDDVGIYYNGKQASRLENLLSSYSLNSYELARSKKLILQLKESSITKYNVESGQDVSRFRLKAGSKALIVVAGQFQQDLSMIYGAEGIKDNLTLLKQVRLDYPDAFIVYKEHPDVYSGVRPGKLDENQVLALADEYVTDTSLTDLFSITDRLCTICSLAGFEALIHGVAVSTYGLPFYAGWGLTHDQCTIPRRKRQLTLEELSYITLVLYARYVNWGTRQITTVESTINALVCDRSQTMQLKSNWLARQWRNISNLFQALFKIRGTHKNGC